MKRATKFAAVILAGMISITTGMTSYAQTDSASTAQTEQEAETAVAASSQAEEEIAGDLANSDESDESLSIEDTSAGDIIVEDIDNFQEEIADDLGEYTEVGTSTDEFINPVYENELDLEDVPDQIYAQSEQDTEEASVDSLMQSMYMDSAAMDATEAGPLLKSAMLAKESTVVINTEISIALPDGYDELATDDAKKAAVKSAVTPTVKQFVLDTINSACSDSDSPVEEDYLKYGYLKCKYSFSYLISESNIVIKKITFKELVYSTTAQQEVELTAKVDEILASMQLDGKSDYEKAKAIYDYITSTVAYDYTHTSNTYYPKYSAYAAVFDHTAVCQGYATLLYRMLRQEGISTKIITSTTHAWNIIQIGDLYYNADSTWDAGRTSYSYFLKGSNDFRNHPRQSAFTTAAFTTKYPTSTTNYQLAVNAGNENNVNSEIVTGTPTSGSDLPTTQNNVVTPSAEADTSGNAATTSDTSNDDNNSDSNGSSDNSEEESTQEATHPTNGWEVAEDGRQYWYENGVKQGLTGRGKEIYDPGTDAWYWLDSDNNGAKAVSKDVFMPYFYGSDSINSGNQAANDNFGKWVRYDADGHMLKGWQTSSDGARYYFDVTTGEMAHGICCIDGTNYQFDNATGIYVGETTDNWEYWYENGTKQGIEGRGKEIVDPKVDRWFWLDSLYNGKKATGKEVLIPYTYQGQDSIEKWVRYDVGGAMVKGWYQKKYYYDPITGAMAKGTVKIGSKTYHFNEDTGVLER